MIPQFHDGEHVYFSLAVHARTSPSRGGNLVIVNQGAKGTVCDYSREATTEDTSDDFVGVKIVEGDEAKGQTVWVSFAECSKLHKTGY